MSSQECADAENLIFCSGINSKFLSSDILTEFRGRGDEVRVYPLSFAEYLSVYNSEKKCCLAGIYALRRVSLSLICLTCASSAS